MKMDEINKIIRDLWRSTYRGQGVSHFNKRALLLICGIFRNTVFPPPYCHLSILFSLQILSMWRSDLMWMRIHLLE